MMSKHPDHHLQDDEESQLIFGVRVGSKPSVRLMKIFALDVRHALTRLMI